MVLSAPAPPRLLKGGFSSSNLLSPQEKQDLQGKAQKLESRLQLHLPPKWVDLVAAPKHGQWVRNPMALYNRWNNLHLPGFGLVKFVRNFYAHVGQLITAGL